MIAGTSASPTRDAIRTGGSTEEQGREGRVYENRRLGRRPGP